MYRSTMFVLLLFCCSVSPLAGMGIFRAIAEMQKNLEEELHEDFKDSIPVIYDGSPLKVNLKNSTIETEFKRQDDSSRIKLTNDYTFWKYIFRASCANTFQTIDITNPDSNVRYEISFKDEQCKKEFDRAFERFRGECKTFNKLSTVIELLDVLNNLATHKDADKIKIDSSVLYLEHFLQQANQKFADYKKMVNPATILPFEQKKTFDDKMQSKPANSGTWFSKAALGAVFGVGCLLLYTYLRKKL